MSKFLEMFHERKRAAMRGTAQSIIRDVLQDNAEAARITANATDKEIGEFLREFARNCTLQANAEEAAAT